MKTLRIFLCAGFGAAALLLNGCQNCCPPGDAASLAPLVTPTSKELQAAMTPAAALAELKSGNSRFVTGHPVKRDPLEDVKATAGGQYPFAVVLSCLDSRQPIELVLDQGIGDIFSARVAGNVLNVDIIGSMEFACKVSGAKLIAVIGHSNCGAIKGAVDGVKLGDLTELLNKIQPAVEAVPAEATQRNSKNLDFVDQVAEANVRLVMRQIPERSPILKELAESGRIQIVGGMYDLSTGEVRFFNP
ncbi:MAG: carbonic anhydrase family protein [Verrucomicrobiota bacterium]